MILILAFLLSTAACAQEFVPVEPVGGNAQLRYFISQELLYPESALLAPDEGVVSIRFAADNTGKILNYQLIKTVTPACNNEALRIFRLIEWHPALRRGIPVVDTGYFEIEFSKKKYARLCRQRGYSTILQPYEPTDSSGIIFAYNKLETRPYPVFTNNNITLSGFVAANMIYPEAAIKQNMSGVVKLSFVVETNGHSSNINVINSVGAGCTEEAIRLLKLIKWMPGTIGNQAVRSRLSLTLSFSLDGQEAVSTGIRSSYGE